MSRTPWYPKASRSQDFSKSYVGSAIRPDVAVLHSTEGTGWPGYNGGATAPNFTIRPNFATKRAEIRQHFPVNRSSRALENRAGGVQTNTQNAVQIELVGTCDPAAHKKWGSAQHIYMPEAPDWFLQDVADLLEWLAAEWETFPLKDAAPRGWLPYPKSYGSASGQRLTFAEWGKAYGVLGHQHIPENAHGDPGAFPITRLLAYATGTTTPVPTKPVATAPSNVDKMNPANYPPSGYTQGAHILWLSQRLVAHSFKKTAGPKWSATQKAAVKAFQKAQGWTGTDADGFVGPTTLKLLAAAPKTAAVKPTTPPIVVTTWNLKSPTLLGSWPVWAVRRVAQIKTLKKIRPDVFLVQEAGKPSHVKWYDSALKNLDLTNAHAVDKDGSGKWRVIYYDPKMFELVTKGFHDLPSSSLYEKDQKPMVWAVARHRKTGDLYLFASFHLENDNPADEERVEQMQAVLAEVERVRKARNIPLSRVFVGGDTNSEAWVRDWVHKNTSYRDAFTVAEDVTDAAVASINAWKAPRRGARADLLLVGVDAQVETADQEDGRTGSDHNPQTITVAA